MGYVIDWIHISLPAGAGLLGRRRLYAVGGSMYSSLMTRYDASAGCWLSCDGPRTPRLHAAVTGCSGLLYVAGGRSQVNQVLAAVEVSSSTMGVFHHIWLTPFS